MPSRRTAGAALVLGVAASLALPACDGSSPGTGTSAGGTAATSSRAATAPRGDEAPHDDADVTFARSMISHHWQAIEMAELADGRAGNSRVAALATKIQAEQGAEIDTMTGWLKGWGIAVGPPAMGSGNGSTPGMQSDADMSALGGLSGPAFDRKFLSMMIGHHQGAVEMAQTEQARGKNAEATALAAKVVQDQGAEIAEMQSLLGQL